LKVTNGEKMLNKLWLPIVFTVALTGCESAPTVVSLLRCMDARAPLKVELGSHRNPDFKDKLDRVLISISIVNLTLNGDEIATSFSDELSSSGITLVTVVSKPDPLELVRDRELKKLSASFKPKQVLTLNISAAVTINCVQHFKLEGEIYDATTKKQLWTVGYFGPLNSDALVKSVILKLREDGFV
jgi:hypothetical protein